MTNRQLIDWYLAHCYAYQDITGSPWLYNGIYVIKENENLVVAELLALSNTQLGFLLDIVILQQDEFIGLESSPSQDGVRPSVN